MDKKQIKAEYRQKTAALRGEFRQKKKEYTSARRVLVRERDEQLTEAHSRAVVDPPRRPLLEEIGNAVTHGLGSVFSIVAFLLMITHAENAWEAVSASLYFAGMFIMFTMSCLYHAFRHGSGVKRLFRRFDHLSIYLLIGATFVPPLLCYIGGAYGLVFFIIQWVIIATGVTLMAVFGPNRLKRLHLPMYLILGWSALMLLPRLLAGDVGFALWILAGGVIYSLGVIPFLMKKGPTHFIWHFFVLAGAVVQWIGIWLYIYQ